MHSISASFHRPAVGARAPRPGGRTANLRGVLASRLGRELLTFGAIGVVSTVAYAVLFVLFRPVTGVAVANALALVVTAVGNTAANRRLTFGTRGGRSMARDQAGGLVALAVALAITTASASLLDAIAPRPGRLIELAVLVGANALATVARFALLRRWIATDRGPALANASASPNTQE